MEKTKNKERERENKGSKKNAARGVVRVVTCLDATAHPSSSIIVLERERERDLCNPLLFPKGNIFPNPVSSLLPPQIYKNLSLVRTKTLIIKANTNVFFPSQRRVLFVRSFVRCSSSPAMWCWPFEQRPIIIIIPFVGSVFGVC